MNTRYLLGSLLTLTLTSCNAESSADHAELMGQKKSQVKRFKCTLGNDSVSKEFRPKQMTKDIEVSVVTNTIKKVSIEIGKKGKTPTKGNLKSISGDEGYTEFTVSKDIEKTYGFSYVIVSYDEEDEKSTPTGATLVNGGEFAVCE